MKLKIKSKLMYYIYHISCSYGTELCSEVLEDRSSSLLEADLSKL